MLRWRRIPRVLGGYGIWFPLGNLFPIGVNSVYIGRVSRILARVAKTMPG